MFWVTLILFWCFSINIFAPRCITWVRWVLACHWSPLRLSELLIINHHDMLGLDRQMFAGNFTSLIAEKWPPETAGLIEGVEDFEEKKIQRQKRNIYYFILCVFSLHFSNWKQNIHTWQWNMGQIISYYVCSSCNSPNRRLRIFSNTHYLVDFFTALTARSRSWDPYAGGFTDFIGPRFR